MYPGEFGWKYLSWLRSGTGYWFNVKFMTALYHTVETDPNILTLHVTRSVVLNARCTVE